MKISRFRTDSDLEENGVWVDIGEGAKLLIARAGNTMYKRVFSKLTRPYRQQIRSETLDEDVAQSLLVRTMAKTILLDWEGLQDDDGNLIPYSVDTAYKMMMEMRDFRDLVSELSTSAESFRNVEVSEATESLGEGSDGS